MTLMIRCILSDITASCHLNFAEMVQCLYSKNWYKYVYLHYKNAVRYLTMQSANHTFIWVISTPTVLYNTPLVWYAHFVFYNV